ncbi:MAG: hypothetical protein M3322_11745 [Actinomycetota bacterium]|nr:hypothetical protein [Actinomycetota bacterium]
MEDIVERVVQRIRDRRRDRRGREPADFAYFPRIRNSGFASDDAAPEEPFLKAVPEAIDADEVVDRDDNTRLFSHLAHDGVLRCFTLFDRTAWEAIPPQAVILLDKQNPPR